MNRLFGSWPSHPTQTQKRSQQEGRENPEGSFEQILWTYLDGLNLVDCCAHCDTMGDFLLGRADSQVCGLLGRFELFGSSDDFGVEKRQRRNFLDAELD